jgi:uncharacterized membrane protein
MTFLILGLVIFLGVHSLRIYGEGWRTRTITRVGEGPFKGVYSLVSLAGLVLLIYGFGVAREAPVMLWMPPLAMRHVAALLMLLAFILLAAAHGKGNAIKARVHHPMVLAVKTWALAHLLANGSVAHVVLFGSFLAWGVVDFVVSRRRDRALGTQYPAGKPSATAIVLVSGIAMWALFAFVLHGWLIGIKPFG